MLIEYQLKFDKNGLTLTQRVEPGASDSPGNGEIFVEASALKASFQESKQANTTKSRLGGGPDSPTSSDTPGGGLPDLGAAPITIIGPFIICRPFDDFKKEDKE